MGKFVDQKAPQYYMFLSASSCPPLSAEMIEYLAILGKIQLLRSPSDPTHEDSYSESCNSSAKLLTDD